MVLLHWSPHMLIQVIDGVDVGVVQLKALDQGLVGSWGGKLRPPPGCFPNPYEGGASSLKLMPLVALL